jgi:hypothetical protein
MFKKILFLIIAIGLAIIATFVQQVLDNELPYKVSVEISDTAYTFALPRVNEGVVDCIVELNVANPAVHGYIHYRLYNSNGTWRKIKLLRLNEKLVSIIPYQKPMIKIEYYLELVDGQGKIYPIAKNQPLVVLFREQVPRLLTYIIALLLFVSLIISNYMGMVTAFNIPYFLKYVRLMFYLLGTAIVLDFAAYLYAYRHLFVVPSPYNDMLFFKNLIIFAIWAILFYVQKNGKERRLAVLAGSLLTLVLYCAPDHFVFQAFF